MVAFRHFAAIVVCTGCLLVNEDVYAQEDTLGSVSEQCNRTIKEGQGIIASPDFTTIYPNNLHCRWNIEVESGRTVTFTFGYFDVERSVNCQYDRVSIFNGPTNDHPMLGRFCGPFRPGQQISTSNKMLITMDTDDSNGKRGFYGFFMSASPTLAHEGSCGGLLTGVEGSFHSPNYPKSNYPPSITCSWHIKVATDNVILLSFNVFDIEQSRECKYDAVVVYAGWTNSDKTKFLGRFCGDVDDMPSTITSPGNELFVTFVSDASGFAAGFSADFGAKRMSRVTSDFPIDTTTTSTTSSSATTTSTTTTTTTTTRKTTTTIPTTVPTTIPTTIPTASTAVTAQQSIVPFQCPYKCPSKIKLKGRICSSSYVVVIRLTAAKTLRAQSIAPVQIVKYFKHGSLPSSATTNLRIVCRRCSNLSKKGSYLLAGDTVTNEGIEIRPGDLVVRYKERKHTKQVTKFIKRCRVRRNPRKGRRAAKERKEQ